MTTTDTALIAIDVQYDFCPGGRLAVAGGDEVVAPINRLIARLPHAIATQDWHPADHASFADNHPGSQPFSTIRMPYGEQTLWPAHCVQGTRGAALRDELDPKAFELIVRKGFRCEIDSYSAFFENDRATPTGLAGYLRERGLTKLVLAGIATDYCVAYSALDAARLGFQTTLALDACRGIDLGGTVAIMLEKMRAAGVTIASSDEI
jgi:nicotinamidase/pyrazinamidase